MVRLILQTLQIIYYLGYIVPISNMCLSKYSMLYPESPVDTHLFAIWLTSFIARYKIVIDFHNYGYTILNMNIKNQVIIRLAICYEKYFARKAHYSFCVSD